MVWLVHRIKPYTIEAERKIERNQCTFTGSTENRHKLVAGTQLETNPHTHAANEYKPSLELTCPNTDGKNITIAYNRQSKPDHKTGKKQKWSFMSSFVVFRSSVCIYLYISATPSYTNTLKVTFENIHITARVAHALSSVLISSERHYMFSASKTAATIISHRLFVMEL